MNKIEINERENKLLNLIEQLVAEGVAKGVKQGIEQYKNEEKLYNIPINVDTIKEGYPILCA